VQKKPAFRRVLRNALHYLLFGACLTGWPSFVFMWESTDFDWHPMARSRPAAGVKASVLLADPVPGHPERLMLLLPLSDLERALHSQLDSEEWATLAALFDRGQP
jgi:hypothetical protein